MEFNDKTVTYEEPHSVTMTVEELLGIMGDTFDVSHPNGDYYQVILSSVSKNDAKKVVTFKLDVEEW